MLLRTASVGGALRVEMETLVVVTPHQSQYYSRRKSQIGDRFGGSPSIGFREINCRYFQSESVGILPNPFKACSNGNCFSPKTPPTSSNSVVGSKTCNGEVSKPIPISPTKLFDDFNNGVDDDLSFYYSELWAGPTYSNSPPPSSLPIPKFSLRQKRSVSLELPVAVAVSGIKMHPISKSAPSSPTQSFMSSPSSFASATKDLRRILHLEE
ncbi:hypothetical protein GIB67_033574 [Kingdonia uniflora]|uniref:Uncharacterized protein n=1 Tax=Kingdonia uniflora TaxID=39325 RepID=A0A7J7L6F1_9MAGN|nr:hypothetical protein GIB67_033574 [Kingdonia uniflora]